MDPVTERPPDSAQWSGSWLAFLGEWWRTRRSTPSRAGELADLPTVAALVRPGSTDHSRAVQLGTILHKAEGTGHGVWRVERSALQDLRNKTSHFELQLIGLDPSPPTGPEPPRRAQVRTFVHLSDEQRQVRALRGAQRNAQRLQRLFRLELQGVEGRIAAGGDPESRCRETLLLARAFFEGTRGLLMAFRLAMVATADERPKVRPSKIELILTDATRPQIDAPTVPAPPAMDEPSDPGDDQDDEQQQAQHSTESAETPEPGTQAAVLAALDRLYADEPDDEEEG